MVIAVLNSKGGVGKSTIAVHAAVWLAAHGRRLAVLDADAQASTSQWLARAAPHLRVERCETAAQIRERLPRLAAAYERVVADGPAALSAETVLLAAAADLVLLPVGPSMMDVWASYRTARLIYRIRLREAGGDRPRVYTVLNRVQPRTRLAEVAREATRRYGFPLAATVVHLRQAYAEACGRRSVVAWMGTGARAAADELDRLFAEVLDTRAPAAAKCPPVPVGPAQAREVCPPNWPAAPGSSPRSLPLSSVLTAGSRVCPTPRSPRSGGPPGPASPGASPSPSPPTAASSCSTGASTPRA